MEQALLRDWGVFELRGKHDEKYLLDNLEEWRPAGQVAADFAVGAQHALMWAYRRTDEPPVPFT